MNPAKIATFRPETMPKTRNDATMHRFCNKPKTNLIPDFVYFQDLHEQGFPDKYGLQY